MSLFGLVNVHKPPGCTSRDVVNVLQKRLKGTKVGHAGTLDPIAEGVLILCVGPATRLVPWVHRYDKSYDGTFLIGRSSPSDDIATDQTVVPVPPDFSRTQLAARIPEFLGNITQVPSTYSAIKVNGVHAYKQARAGKSVEVPARQVRIDRIQLTDCDAEQFSISVDCGTGTYIRSLGRDLAQAVGTSAVMSALVRTRIGPFQLADAVSLEQLQTQSVEELLVSPREALHGLPEIALEGALLKRLQNGERIAIAPHRLLGVDDEHPAVILSSDQKLIAIATNKAGKLAPLTVFRREMCKS